MKIKFKLLVVCLLAIIIGRVCLSKEKKDIQAAVSIPQKIVEVQITPKMPSIQGSKFKNIWCKYWLCTRTRIR